MELTDDDILEIRDIPYAPKTRVVFKKEYCVSVSATGLVGVAPRENPDWPVFVLAIADDDCLAGEQDLDLPEGFSFLEKTESDGVKALRFVHLLKKKHILVPAFLIESVLSLSKNFTVWRKL